MKLHFNMYSIFLTIAYN